MFALDAPAGAERGKVVRAEKHGYIGPHPVPIDIVKHHPCLFVKERLFPVYHRVRIPPRPGRMPRMKLRRRLAHAIYADVVVEHGIHTTFAPRKVDAGIYVYVRALRSGVHPRVGAARARYAARTPHHGGKRGIERVLDAGRVFLRLPPAVSRTVVFDSEEIAHRSLPYVFKAQPQVQTAAARKNVALALVNEREFD